MKVKVIKDCYYNLEFIKAGRIIDFKGKSIPSWATLADGIETKRNKKEAAPLDNVGQDNPDDVKTPVNPDEDKKPELDNVGQDDKKEEGEAAPVNPEEQEKAEEKAPEASPEELEYLDKLINEGIEKGILIEDADKKTVKEQIAELEVALKK